MSDGTPEKVLDTLVLQHRAFDPAAARFGGGERNVPASRLDRHLGFPRATRRNSEEAA